MNMRGIRALVFALLLSSTDANGQIKADSTNRVPPAVLRAFEEAMRTELGLLTPSIRDSAKQSRHAHALAQTTAQLEATLDISKWKIPGLILWTAFPSRVDHWHRYTVAEFKGAVFRLGGFTAPELVSLDKMLPPAKDALLSRATLLAAIADRNGGENLTISDSSLTRLPSGETIVWVLAESLQSRAFRPMQWKTFYSFLFSVNGGLLEWSRHERSTVQHNTR